MSDDEVRKGNQPSRPKLDLVVLDCPDAMELARFYGEVLGWEIEDGSDRNWATLVPPGGGLSRDNPDGRSTLAFQRIEDFVRPSWPGGSHPQQFHLDLWAGDIATLEPAVLAAGATVHDHQPSENGSFKVYVDPCGHPFCLVGEP
jgi:catechol 2,3-dioxygenase-like lactoylglutathione lyase family enzyme